MNTFNEYIDTIAVEEGHGNINTDRYVNKDRRLYDKVFIDDKPYFSNEEEGFKLEGEQDV